MVFPQTIATHEFAAEMQQKNRRFGKMYRNLVVLSFFAFVLAMPVISIADTREKTDNNCRSLFPILQKTEYRDERTVGRLFGQLSKRIDSDERGSEAALENFLSILVRRYQLVSKKEPDPIISRSLDYIQRLLVFRNKFRTIQQTLLGLQRCWPADQMIDHLKAIVDYSSGSFTGIGSVFERSLDDPILASSASFYLPMVYQRTKGMAEGRNHLLERLKSRKLDPNLLDALAMLAIIENRRDEAIGLLKQSLVVEPEDQRAIFLIAEQYTHLGKYKDAGHYLKLHLKQNPYHHAGVAMYLKIELAQGHRKKVEAYLDGLVAARPNDGWYLTELAKLEIRSDKIDKAKQHLRRALALDQKNLLTEVSIGWGPAGWYFAAFHLLVDLLRKKGDFNGIAEIYRTTDRHPLLFSLGTKDQPLP